jgi:3-oxoacyl-[acyl-carrier protein] reductase
MAQSSPRTIIVTGGNSGIGKGIATAFARQRSNVVIIGRNEETLQNTARQLGSHVTWRKADVSNREEVAAAAEAIVKLHGQIDVLVNNAGFLHGVSTGTPLEMAESLWDEVLDTDLKGCFLMALAVAPHLRRPGGRIINISSIAAFTGGNRPGTIAYAAAKAGLHGLTYSLARELSPQGITVNAIAPGFIAHTGFTDFWPEERAQNIIGQTPAGRAGTVGDVASAALFLASPEASFITGEILNVNGGWIFGH